MLFIERYYGNSVQSPEVECSNDIIDKAQKGVVLISHTTIPRGKELESDWAYFIHAVFNGG